jgi:hypothetical protein
MPIATMRPKSWIAGEEHIFREEKPIAVVKAAREIG